MFDLVHMGVVLLRTNIIRRTCLFGVMAYIGHSIMCLRCFMLGILILSKFMMGHASEIFIRF
jgi:hypothetical protein